jgi:hypothetical protein
MGLIPDPNYPGILLGTIVTCITDQQKMIACATVKIVGDTSAQTYQVIFGMNVGENNWNLLGTQILFIPGSDDRTSGSASAAVIEREAPSGSQYGPTPTRMIA